MTRPIFQHRSITIPQGQQGLHRITKDGVRHYSRLGQHNSRLGQHKLFPSITAILGSQEKPEIEKWRNRVGKEEAERQKNYGANKGTLLHNAVEAYMKNEPHFPKGTPTNVIEMFRKIQPLLNQIEEVIAIELPMINYDLEAAGTTDYIVRYNSMQSGKKVNAVLDIKSGKTRRFEGVPPDYWEQTQFYGETWNSEGFSALNNFHIDHKILLFAYEEESAGVEQMVNCIKGSPRSNVLHNKIREYHAATSDA